MSSSRLPISTSRHLCGRRATGHYENGLIHGHGRLEAADGSIYEGNFEYGKRNGSGTFLCCVVCSLSCTSGLANTIIPPNLTILHASGQAQPSGRTAKRTKASTKMTNDTDKAFIPGPIGTPGWT